MSRQRADKREYRVYYGVDSNAALQPQYVPQPERKRKPEQKPSVSKAREAKALRKLEVARCMALTMLVISVAAMGFLVVTRNAEIYSNNRQIRELAKEKAELQILVNTAEKDGSVSGELNSYFDIAENQLALDYPTEDNIVTVVLPAMNVQEETQAQESVNAYDMVLDFFSSLGRGIKSWA